LLQNLCLEDTSKTRNIEEEHYFHNHCRSQCALSMQKSGYETRAGHDLTYWCIRTVRNCAPKIVAKHAYENGAFSRA